MSKFTKKYIHVNTAINKHMSVSGVYIYMTKIKTNNKQIMKPN